MRSDKEATQPGAVVLLSGGLDSATVLAQLAKTQVPIYALSFSYGQRQTVELKAAEKLAKRFGVVKWQVAHVDLAAFGGSALTCSDMEVPKGVGSSQSSGIPVTYVPARNTLFLAYALAWAEALGIRDIYIGANAVDYSGYPDCRPAFITAFEQLANTATRAVDGGAPYRIVAPLMHLHKHEIIARGISLGVDYAETHSCYDPQNDRACGACDACRLRREGFEKAGVTDPTRYDKSSRQ